MTRGRQIVRAACASAAALGLAVALATAPAVAAVDRTSGGATHALPKIKGTVGPGFDITIHPESVPAGRYRLVVRDRGTIHNFHFFGSGVDHETSVPGTGRTVWRVTLIPGTYIAACEPHGSMSTRLEVT